jgi:negative regulator of flagellin synthesis FlgM
MKITHNKVGQNLNSVDGAKTESAKKSGKGGPVASAASALTGESDASKVDLSPRAMEAKRIKDLAMSTPDVDIEKVARFQKMIDDGNYKVDSKAVADKMVDEHLETME